MGKENVSYHIREAREEDRERFVFLCLELAKFNRNNHDMRCAFDDFQEVLSLKDDEARKTFNLRGGDPKIFVAEREGKIMGYALGRIVEAEPNADNGRCRMGLLDELMVDSAARGEGMGKALMDAMILFFQSLGLRRIRIHAYAWNSRARSLYEESGFQQYALSYEKFL